MRNSGVAHRAVSVIAVGEAERRSSVAVFCTATYCAFTRLNTADKEII
jgi:hypothetical protein